MTDFNVYKWRRNMIQENVGADDLESIKKLPFTQAIKAYYGNNEPTHEEVNIFTDLYFGNPTSLNEEAINIVKQAETVYNSLLKGGYLVDGASKNIVINRIMFALRGQIQEGEAKVKVSQITFEDLGDKNILPTSIGMGSARRIKDENDLEAWRSEFIKKYGDIELIKQSAGWSAPMDHSSNQQAQSIYDKSKYKGD